MKNYLQCILLVASLLFIFACNEKAKKTEIKDQYLIQGNLSGFPDGTKFYLQNLATDSNIDISVIQKGKFKMDGHLFNPPEQLWLTATVDNHFNYTNLLIGNDSLSIHGNINDFPWNVKKKRFSNPVRI